MRLRGMPKLIGPLVIYSWGMDLKLLTGRTLVVSWRCGLRAYVSADATPPRNAEHGYYIFGPR